MGEEKKEKEKKLIPLSFYACPWYVIPAKILLVSFCRIEKDYQMEIKKKKKSFNLVVQFLLMELETVGNVRFEEGLSNNPW